jgi:indoleamine 2,3-dioxygenase
MLKLNARRPKAHASRDSSMATSHSAATDLKRFDVQPERGFLPEHDPERALPAPLALWQELASELPKRLAARRVRSAVRALPRFELAALRSPAEERAAMRALSFLGHAYVWEGASPEATLPQQLAAPWSALASKLGRPPILSYGSYALDNWRRFDARGPLTVDNLAILQNFLGGQDEDWFILIHVEIEALAARALNAALPALAAARAGDASALTARLEEVAGALEAMLATLRRMPERCDPFIYFRRVRPFIHGWKNHPALPDGVCYEGAAELPGPQRLRGETGAQSTIVPVLDALLGVAHAPDPLREYLDEMRAYMPPGHRGFLAHVEAGGSVRGAVRELRGSHPELAEMYDACLRWLEAFRSLHLEYAASYIHTQGGGAANPSDVGTGGTPFMRYLAKHRDETAKHRVS